MPAYQHATVRSLLRRIDEGELYLPLIQRDIVWSREQILFLIDSLLRRYPIGTLLLWRTALEVRARRFVAKYRPGMRLSDLEVPTTATRRDYVLDGQQRLQALYIALYGAYDGEVVHLDLLSRPEVAAEFELRYALIFARPDDASLPITTVPLRELVMTGAEPMELIRAQRRRIKDGGRNLTNDEENRVEDLVSRVQNVFTQQEVLTYFLADASEQPQFNDLDEVLEIFIRVNSGGTKLDISDLLFAIVKTEWLTAQEQFEEFLDELNGGGLFAFDKDDLLRICLLLTGHGAAYELSKLRGEPGDTLIREVREQWSEIRTTIRQVMDFTTQRAQIRTQRVLRSKNALLPLMDFMHRMRARGGHLDDGTRLAMQRWLYRVLLERQFGGQSVTLLNRCDDVIRRAPGGGFPELGLLRTLRLLPELTNDAILDRGRGTTQESVLPVYVAYLQAGIGSPDFAPLYEGNTPEVDHIVPQSWLRRRYKEAGREPADDLINNVGNYRLLEKDENRDKTDELPDVYYAAAAANETFRKRHFIEPDVALGRELTIEQYEAFVRVRRRALFDRIKAVLSPPGLVLEPIEGPERGGELWTEDETILAYALLKDYGRFPTDSMLAELGHELGRAPGAVGRKVANLISAETGGTKGLPKGSHVDEEVALKYRLDLKGLQARAATIQAPRTTAPNNPEKGAGRLSWPERSTKCLDCGGRYVDLDRHKKRQHAGTS